MEYKIVFRPAFKVVGCAYVGHNQNGEIPQLWDRFLARMQEPRGIHPGVCYGLCMNAPVGSAEGAFEYVAGVEVADDGEIPAGMVYREVPAYKYAVFTHSGPLDTLMESMYAIYRNLEGLTWAESQFNMEVYSEDFIPGHPDSRLYIYMAIQ